MLWLLPVRVGEHDNAHDRAAGIARRRRTFGHRMDATNDDGGETMKKQWTKRDVVAWCKEREIAISDERYRGRYHVHLDICADSKIFRALGVHSAAVWESDDQRPDWNLIGRELMGLDFGDCLDASCAYCHDDETSEE
jgi:hypothetical protein